MLLNSIKYQYQDIRNKINKNGILTVQMLSYSPWESIFRIFTILVILQKLENLHSFMVVSIIIRLSQLLNFIIYLQCLLADKHSRQQQQVKYKNQDHFYKLQLARIITCLASNSISNNQKSQHNYMFIYFMNRKISFHKWFHVSIFLTKY